MRNSRRLFLCLITLAISLCGAQYGCGSDPAEGTLASATPQEGVIYYIDDHLGNTHLITDSLGNVLHEESRYPYGLKREAKGEAADYVYTGKEYDEETGLIYFGGRYYSPQLGRWLTPDPLFLENEPKKLVESPLEFNLYSYVRNNPVTFVDEKGFKLTLARGTSEEDKQQYNAAISYFYANGLGDLVDKLEAHPKTIYIHMTSGGKLQFDPRDASHLRIDWDPKSGLYVAQGARDTYAPDSKGGVIQSPAVGLYHELGHGSRFLSGTYSEGIEEEMAVLTQYEIPAAQKLDEPVRFHYHGSAIPVSSSTSKRSALIR